MQEQAWKMDLTRIFSGRLGTEKIIEKVNVSCTIIFVAPNRGYLTKTDLIADFLYGADFQAMHNQQKGIAVASAD